MAKFVITPHFRLHEWVAEEKGYFKAEGLDYEFREAFKGKDLAKAHATPEQGRRLPEHRGRARHQRELRLPLDGERRRLQGPRARCTPTPTRCRPRRCSCRPSRRSRTRRTCAACRSRSATSRAATTRPSRRSSSTCRSPTSSSPSPTASSSRGMEKLIDRKVPAAAVFCGPYYFLEQLGFRKVIDTTFMMASMLNGDPDPRGREEILPRAAPAQRDIDLRPELYTHYYRNEFPARFLAQMDTRRWGPGERIVFEPYTKEVFEESFKLDPRAQHLRGAGHGRGQVRRRLRLARLRAPCTCLAPVAKALQHRLRRRNFRRRGAAPGDARLRGGAGARRGADRRDPGGRGGSDREPVPGRAVRPASDLAGRPPWPAIRRSRWSSALTALVAAENGRGGALRALGRHQPGRDGHRARAATARLPPACSPRSRAARRGARPAGGGHRETVLCRPDLAAAGAPGHLRPQGRGLARCRQRHPAACGLGPRRWSSSSAAQRDARVAGGRGLGSPRRSRRGLSSPARPALARPARPPGRARRLARPPGRHARQDRPRFRS